MERDTMTNAEVLYRFWASFGLPTYDETSVPAKAQLPYLTYETALDSFGNEVALTASLWYRDTGWEAITIKANQINAAISRGGRMLATENGALWLKRGTPFAQRMADTDDSIRRIVINVTVEFIEQ